MYDPCLVNARLIGDFLKENPRVKVLITGDNFRQTNYVFDCIAAQFGEREFHAYKRGDESVMETLIGSRLRAIPLPQENGLCGERANWLVMTSGFAQSWMQTIGAPLVACNEQFPKIKNEILMFQK